MENATDFDGTLRGVSAKAPAEQVGEPSSAVAMPGLRGFQVMFHLGGWKHHLVGGLVAIFNFPIYGV